MKRFRERSKASLPGWYESLYKITHDHILFARRHPKKLDEIATRLGISNDMVLAAIISDEISEEFTLTKTN